MSDGLAQIQYLNDQCLLSKKGRKADKGYLSQRGWTCQSSSKAKNRVNPSQTTTEGSELSSFSLTQDEEPSNYYMQNGFVSSSNDSHLLPLRGQGWGHRRSMIGLRGGGEMANGTGGWGTPPSGGAMASGWGAPPPPNPSISAAWGQVQAQNQASPDDPQHHDGSPVKNNPVKTQTSPQSQPQLTSTSWAAAAGKGLSASEAPSSNNATSVANEPTARQLEQLNSVREALFSQDGWGSNHVKQESAWNVDGVEQNFQPAPKENPSSPTWESPDKQRNDGTDLWKSTLSGQPLVTKSSTASQWHKPQNPTDYKNWGEEDDNSAVYGAVGGASSTNGLGSVGSNREGSIWNSSQPMQSNSSQGKPPPAVWSNERPKEQNFSDSPTSPVEGQNWNQTVGQRHPNSWGVQNQQVPNRTNPEWGEAAPLVRHNSANGGTGIWGNKQPPSQPPAGSNWKDMPPRNTGSRMNSWNNNVGWNEQPDPNNLWGIEKPDPNRWGDSQWPGGPRGRAPPVARNSPAWEDQVQDSGGWRQDGPKKSYNPDIPRSSKQFKVLMTMGFSPDDAEYALRTTGGVLEDAYEMLNANRMREQNSTLYQQGPQESGNMQMMQPPQANMGPQDMYGYKMNQQMPPMRPQEQQKPTATTNQLKVLVTQIQMAVQAGHLNPRILHQPLAPQTLVCLNKLLSEVKALQILQQQQQQQGSMAGGPGIMTINLNISKAKQSITNLQNQINHHQNNYLQKNSMMGNQQAPQQLPQMNNPPYDQPMQEMYPYGQPPSTPTMESHMIPGGPNKSRLSLWKLPQEGGDNRPQGANMKTGLGFDDSTWSSSANTGGSNWPDSKPSATTPGGLVSGDNASSSLDAFGIPEFEPGKLWKGIGMKNPDDDPSLTPGSMAQIDINALTKATSAVSIQSQNENQHGSDGGNNFGLSKVWPNSGQNGSVGGSMSDGLMGESNQSWVVFRNLTQQIDSATLKTWCVQQGPVKQFHAFAAQSIALALYASDGIALKAQKSLQNSFTGSNVQVQLLGDPETANLLQQLGGASGAAPGNGAQNYGGMSAKNNSGGDVWGTSGSLFSAPSGIWSTPGHKSEAQPVSGFMQDDFLPDNM